MKTYEEVLEILKLNNATHLLRFYDELSNEEKADLLEQISNIDFDLMQELYINRNTNIDAGKDIKPIECIKEYNVAGEEKEEYIKIGEEVIRARKNCCLPTCRWSRLEAWT